MIYNEVYIGTAGTVDELITLLQNKIPWGATVDVDSIEHSADAEVWYDKDTNTVIIK